MHKIIATVSAALSAFLLAVDCDMRVKKTLSVNARQLKYLSESGTGGLKKEIKRLCFPTKKAMQN